MSRQEIIASKEKSKAELMMIVALIAIMMAVFLEYFFRQEETLTGTGFSALKGRFVSEVQVIHGQWLMDGEPALVKQKNAAGQLTQIRVNKQGWVDSTSDNQRCHDIWIQVIGSQPELLKKPVSVIEILRQGSEQEFLCRYAISKTQFFEYSPKTGKISL
ncbi:hypothetical protein ACFSJY_16090 [Thalassotalea euphylliae]|uniref:hypothetical protein n=1 Tax=Thalassotalea euphylliae TaxID=1655234 RepID=UPI003638A9FC